jgi:hypothetical protein
MEVFMSRKFAPISIEDLKAKIEKIFVESPDKNMFECLANLFEKVGKDVKVKFDLENIIDDEEGWKGELGGLLGYRQEANGLTYLGLAAGGDWESPVYFMTYWDGKKIRVYIPTEGNPWNRTTKEAYGNDEDADIKDFKKHYKHLLEGVEEEDFDNIDVSGSVEFDKDAIKKDFMTRILPVGA